MDGFILIYSIAGSDYIVWSVIRRLHVPGCNCVRKSHRDSNKTIITLNAILMSKDVVGQ